jgi:hypothetical protein
MGWGSGIGDPGSEFRDPGMEYTYPESKIRIQGSKKALDGSQIRIRNIAWQVPNATVGTYFTHFDFKIGKI